MGTFSGTVLGIATEGTEVNTMSWSTIIVAESANVEHDADVFVGFNQDQSVDFPFNEEVAIWFAWC